MSITEVCLHLLIMKNATVRIFSKLYDNKLSVSSDLDLVTQREQINDN